VLEYVREKQRKRQRKKTEIQEEIKKYRCISRWRKRVDKKDTGGMFDWTLFDNSNRTKVV
jgi:hypothetical protein